MNERKSICSWCSKIIRDGYEPASHDICPVCYPKVMEHVTRVKHGESQESGQVLSWAENDHGGPERAEFISLAQYQGLHPGTWRDIVAVAGVSVLWGVFLLLWSFL